MRKKRRADLLLLLCCSCLLCFLLCSLLCLSLLLLGIFVVVVVLVRKTLKTGLLHQSVQLLTLMLGASHCAELPLANPKGTLIKTVTKKLKNTTLIRSIATDLTDHIMIKVMELVRVVVTLMKSLGIALSHRVTTIKTNSDRHVEQKKEQK